MDFSMDIQHNQEVLFQSASHLMWITANQSRHIPRTCALNMPEGRPCVDQKACNPLPVSLFQIQEDMGRAAQQLQYQNELGVPHLPPNSIILQNIAKV